MKKRKKTIRVLYIYDYKGWAIYNVGILWLKNLAGIQTTFLEHKKFKKKDFRKYDVVWFGYSDLFLYQYAHLSIGSNDLHKCAVSVHDPKELFPQKENWIDMTITRKKWWSISSLQRWIILKALMRVKRVVTTSIEMQTKLQESGLPTFLIPTTSTLPYREKNTLQTEKCDILSVFENYPRKNPSLLKSLQAYCNTILKVKFDTKIGKNILPAERYRQLLDDHEIYVCTSYQEGGPLPAMDAMHRGLVVLSTPVGQMNDIITDSENGFLCKTKNEFIEKIRLLSGNVKLLQGMRTKSLDYVMKKRNRASIRHTVTHFLHTFLVREEKLEEKNTLQFIIFLPILYSILVANKWQALSSSFLNTRR